MNDLKPCPFCLLEGENLDLCELPQGHSVYCMEFGAAKAPPALQAS